MSAMPPNAEVNCISGSATGRWGLMIRPCPTARSAFVQLSAGLFVVAELARVLCAFVCCASKVCAARCNTHHTDPSLYDQGVRCPGRVACGLRKKEFLAQM